MELKWTEISKAINGTDINGLPLAAGTLALDEIIDDRAITLRNVTLANAVFHIHASGGCAVITIDMPESQDASVLEHICKEWLQGLENPEYDNQYLTMTIVPILFAGKMVLVYNQLVYFDSYRTSEGIKAVLAFDNTNTVSFIDENIDMQSIEQEVIAELKKEEQELVDSITEAENEMQNLKGENPYEKAIKKTMNTYQYEMPETEKNPNIRFSSDEEENHEA